MINSADQPPRIPELVYESIPPKQNTLLVLTQGAINLSHVIAHSIINIGHHQLYLFVDWPDSEMLMCNMFLTDLKTERLLTGIQDFSDKAELVKINSLTKEKRKECYVQGGAYSVSAMVLLLDLVGQSELSPRLVSKIFMRDAEFVENYKQDLPWIQGLLLKQNPDVQTILISTNAHYLTLQSFERLYRMFFIKNVIIWPYGRKEILDAVERYKSQKKDFVEKEYSMQYNKSEARIQELLEHLLKYCESATKGIRNSTTNSSNPKTYYEIFMKEKQDFLKNAVDYANNQQMTGLNLIRSLMIKLSNSSPIDFYYQVLTRLCSKEEVGLWSGCTNSTDENIDQLTKLAFNRMFDVQVSQKQPNFVKIKTVEKAHDVNCLYEFRFTQPVPKKLAVLISILDKIANAYEEEWKSNGRRPMTIWVQTADQGIRNTLCEELRGKIYGCSQFLKLKSMLQLFFRLSQEREGKVHTILSRKFYGSKREGGPVADLEDNKFLFMEEFYNQLKDFFDEISLFEESNMITHDQTARKKMQSQDDEQLQTKPVRVQKPELEQRSINLITFKQKLLGKHYKHINIDSMDFSCMERGIYNNEELELIWKEKLLLIVNCCSDISSVAGFINQYRPQQAVFYNPKVSFLRYLYLSKEQGVTTDSLKNVHLINISKSLEQSIYVHSVVKEDQMFWEISKKRVNMPVFNDDINSRVQVITQQRKYRDTRIALNKSIAVEPVALFNMGARLATKRYYYVIVDKREFKSGLPSALYHKGFEVVPVFLKVGDYILANDVAVERKAVETKDIHESLRSGRLQDQVSKMSKKFHHSYILIEFSNKANFKLERLSQFQSYNKSETYSYNVRKGLYAIAKKYPRVKLIWSKSCEETAEYFKFLKQGRTEPDISLYQKEEQSIQKSDPTVGTALDKEKLKENNMETVVQSQNMPEDRNSNEL